MRLLCELPQVKIGDFGLAILGLPSLGNWPRLMVALPFGLVLGMLLAAALAEIFTSRAAHAALRDSVQ